MSRYDDDEDTDTITKEEEPEAPAASGSRYEDESLDKTEAPQPAVSQQARRVVKRGWGNADQVMSSGSPFAQNLKLSPEAVLVKFLEDDPYTSYRQHWLDGRQGQKSFTCISEMNNSGCPLCDAGDRPSARFAFNVVMLAEDMDPTVKSYELGPRDIDTLKNLHQDPRQGPLPKHYWAISRTGKGSTSQRAHQMVRERDMQEEWNIEPLTEAQITSLMKNAYDAGIVPIPSRKTLADIAAEELGSE